MKTKPDKANEVVALKARVASELGGLTRRVMFAPAGKHMIACGCGPASAVVTLQVDRETAAVLQASLQALNARHAPQRALFDKHHEAKEAMAWPVGFEWSDSPEPGVYAVVEWSKLGEEYVNGKVLRAFSGSFFSDADLPKRKMIKAGQTYEIAAGKRGSEENPARMTGLDFPFAGTLTNDPAFRQIMPLWAENRGIRGKEISGIGMPGKAGATGGRLVEPSLPRERKESNESTNNNNIRMKPEERAALQAKRKQLEQDIEGLKGQEQTAEVAEALQAKNAELSVTVSQLELADQQDRNAQLESALLAQRTKDAKAAVQAAVKRGAIPAQNTALQAKWEARCIEDPETLELLASMKGSVAVGLPRLTVSSVQITREDSVTVLKAYNMERDPLKKGALYANELSKRIRDGEDLPIHAANTLGTLAGEIVTQRTLELLTVELPLISAISTDFSSESAAMNQQVTARIVGIPTSSDYHVDNGYATNDSTMTDVSVTITAHKSVQVGFNANELASTSRRLFDEMAPAMAYRVGSDYVAAALAVITAENFTEAAIDVAEVDFGRKSVIKIGGALSDRGVPTTGRTLLLNSTYHDALFSDDVVALLAANLKPELITGSKMIDLHDFKIARTATLPAAGNLVGFGMSKSALVVAGRVPNDYTQALPAAAGNGLVTTITEPRSGLTVMLVQFVDHQKGKAFARMAYMYGAAKGQAKAGQLVRSAAP